MPVFAALILAAGTSSRMGRCKALLPIGEQSSIARIAGNFRHAGIESIAAVTGHHAEQLKPTLAHLGIRAVPNPNYQHGMYSSVQAGLASLPADVDACFLLPVDIPLVRPTTIAALAAHYIRQRCTITYPRFSGQRGHPPLIDRSLFAEILAGNGDAGLRALLQKHQQNAAEIPVLDEGILLDMDTPEDYGQLAALAQHRHLPTPAECEAILAMQTTAEPLRSHGRAVAAVARTLVTRLAAKGASLNLQLVIAASLLHDIAKGQPDRAKAGAALVADLGYPAVAKITLQHMTMDFDCSSLNETAIVFLADKLVHRNCRVSLEERYRPSFERFREQPEALSGATRRYETALAILAAVERKARALLSVILADCCVPPCPHTNHKG